MRYTIVTADTPEELVKHVSRYHQDAWQVVGGAVPIGWHDHDIRDKTSVISRVTQYMQTLVEKG